MWKTLRINMSSATITEEDFKTEYRGIGGRGLVARVAVEELNPRCDPLGPDNKLILATTAFAGMGVSGANRPVGCKSPLTGGLRNQIRRHLATYMINHGIKLMIIEGQPRETPCGCFISTPQERLPEGGPGSEDSIITSW